MRITKINIPQTDNIHDGLEDIKMDRLDKIVLIAGKNGSGKTRILNKIFSTFQQKPTKSYLATSEVSLKDLNNYFKTDESRIEELKRTKNLLNTQTNAPIQIYSVTPEKIDKQISDLENLLKDYSYRINEIDEKKRWNHIETDIGSDNYSFIKFVPKNLILHDPNSFTQAELLSISSTIEIVGVDTLPKSVFAKIQVIQNRWFNATHQESQSKEEEKKAAIKDYTKLQEIVELFLNTKITRSIDGEATLFGFPLGQSNLSDGQKILLQFCLAIYSQSESLKDLILILDEPENHLHPSVIIETIERIMETVTNGQIWIATHSVPLLSHFDPSSLWYVENGKISYAGRIPEKVLQSLLGDENQIAKLQDFISLPSQFATSRYAFESLFEPAAIITGGNDPQSKQIHTELTQVSLQRKLRVLDYGVGKGRLISNISDLEIDNQKSLIESLDYIGFDLFNTDKEICERTIAKIYGSSENRYFNDFNNLFSNYDKESFDVVIMCNVLHEIDPIEWIELFKPNGTITNCLSENGILLLVEDQQIPIGEKAYQKGFLVLDTPHLKELFKITERDSDFVFSDKNGDGRLKAHQIPKNLLMRIDADSRKKAIQSVSDTARAKIIETRGLEKNYKNGKVHGFWTQKFSNAQLNLSGL